MLDDARWPAASALIDEACGITGNDLMVGEGPTDDVRAPSVSADPAPFTRLDPTMPPTSFDIGFLP